MFSRYALLPLAGLFLGCDLGMISGSEPESLDSTVQSIALSQSYLQPSFSRINLDPYPTDLSQTDLIDVYVSRNGASAYWQIAPETGASDAFLEESAVIVRVVTDAEQTPKRLTFMIKADPGYYPDGGDYYYAVTELDGAISVDEDGLPQAGQLASCARCHLDRASSDWLFGVPLDVRGKAPASALSPPSVPGGYH